MAGVTGAHAAFTHWLPPGGQVRSIWLYVYTHYFDDYDYFYIGGDDLYVIVENLRL